MSLFSKIWKFLIFVAILVLLLIVAIMYVLKMPVFSGSARYATDVVINSEQLKTHVSVLSEDLLPRTCEDAENLTKAAQYVRNELQKWDSNTYFQNYTIGSESFSNVVSEFGPDTDKVIVVGAHYDAYSTLPGADDNASGVAGLIELGRALSEVDGQLEQRIILVAYACEEPPHFGSPNMGSFIHANSLKDKEVTLMISIEMIGYFSNEKNSQEFPLDFLSFFYPDKGNYIAVVGKILTPEASRLKATINKYTDIEALSINAPTSIRGVAFSDHLNYWALDYPAVMVTDTAFYRNFNYHTSGDTFDTLDYENMSEIVFGIFIHILELAKQAK